MDRKSWTSYFFDIAYLAASRSTCLRRKVGAVAVLDKRIIATGYNGAPPNIEHCSVSGCLREKLNVPSGMRHELCMALHAEMNLLTQAASFGLSLKGCSIYCTTQPCVICLKLLLGSKVQDIFFKEPYNCDTSNTLLVKSSANIENILDGEDNITRWSW